MSAAFERAADIGVALPPSSRVVTSAAASRRRSTAWALVVMIGALTAVLYVAAVIPAPGIGTDQAYWWPLVAGLMWAAELAVVRIGVGGRLVTVPLVVAPTVIAFFHLAPAEIVLARLVGSALALAVRRHQTPLRLAITLEGVAAGTSAAVLAFQAGLLVAPSTLVGMGAVSYLGAAAMVMVTALVDGLFAIVFRPHAGIGGLRTSLLVGLVTAFFGTSFAVVAVVFLDSQPGDLWALAVPTLVALVGYRSFSLQRGREARLTFIYDCSQILQRAELDDATLRRLIERMQATFRAGVVEVIVAPDHGAAAFRRAVVDERGGVQVSAVDAELVDARRRLLGPVGSSRRLSRDQLPSNGAIDERVGMVAAIRGATGVIGTVLVADPLDHTEPFATEELRVLETLGSRLGLVAQGTGLAGQLAESADHVRNLAAIVQSSEDAIAAIDTAGRISSWNPAATRLFGFDADEMIGRVASEVIPEPERARVRERFAAALAGAPSSNVRMTWLRRDGTTVPISITISPIRGEHGEPNGVSAIVRDETARRRAEAAADASARRLRTVIEGSPLGMGTAGPAHRWTQANPALCALLGLGPEDTVGRPVTERIHADDLATVARLEDVLFAGDDDVRSVERRYVGGDGRVVWTQVTARLLRDEPDGGPIALYTVEDITERRDAEERTRVTEERFRRAALAITSVQDPSRVINALLDGARETLRAEYAAVATYSEDGRELVSVEGAGDDPQSLQAHLGRVIASMDGLAPARIAGRPIRLGDIHADARQGGAARVRCPVSSLLAVPLGRGAPGHATLFLANKVDAGEFSEGDEAIAVALATHALVCLENARVNAHARELVLDLDRANGELLLANETKTRFLAAVAHELRAPLHAIVIAADLVDDPLAGPLTAKEVKDFGVTVQSSGRHMVRLIDDLSDLARIEAGRMELRLARVPLDELLGEVWFSVGAEARARGVTLELPGRPPPRVTADPVRLRQILTNLVGNAIKFTGRGGTVRVDVACTRSEIRIAVHDTGIGIREEDLTRAFLPFEQVSRTSTPGAGLGLAISRSLAELHGGRLEASSVFGTGSSFTVTLPRRPGPRARREAAIEAGPPLGRLDGAGRPVLVVEDDVAALGLATGVLRTVGYEVWPASGLDEALRALEAGTPALILLDMRLGDGNGLDLIRHVRSDPSIADLPILVVSADTMPEDVRRARDAGCDDFLAKPLRPRVLLERVRQLAERHREAAVARV